MCANVIDEGLKLHGVEGHLLGELVQGLGELLLLSGQNVACSSDW